MQSKIVKWLKERGCYVVKTRPGMGTPVGCPDIIFMYDDEWGAIEVKATEKAPYRVGQKETIQRLQNMSPFVYRACPENWADIRMLLEDELF